MLRNMLNAIATVVGDLGERTANFVDGGTTKPSIWEGIQIAHKAGTLRVHVPRPEIADFEAKVRAYAVDHDMDIGDY